MKFPSSILALASMASLHQTATASCYGSGDTWPRYDWGGYTLGRQEALGWIDFACKGNGGMFTGSFAPGQTKRMCPTSVHNGKPAGFEVQNLNTQQAFDLGDQDCYDRLAAEINGCERGGTSTVAGWRFR